MDIITKYLTNNPCYKSGRTIQVQGLMLHSVGCPQQNPLVFIKNFDKSDYNAACVHGFIGENEAYITLPSLAVPGQAHRGWHCGKGTKGSANNTHLGFEMCEPSCIKYVNGATFTCSDKQKAIKFVEKTTQNAVDLFAQLCKFHNLNPLADGTIISHAEGNKRGIASAHGDPDHLWKQLGMDYNMDKFRQDVYQKINEDKEDDEDMNVDRFKELWLEMRKELQDNDSAQWSEEARAWCIQNKIFAGGGTLPNGDVNYMWEDLLDRQQICQVLYNFAKAIGKA